MSGLTIWAYDWVPEAPRGFVRDLRLRWACEEAGLPYTVHTVPFDDRETNHLAQQPFGQVPYLDDDGFILYESRAIARYIALKYRHQGTPGLNPDVADLGKYARFEQAASVEQSNFDMYASAIAAERVFKP